MGTVFIFHLQGTVDGSAHSWGPSVSVFECKPELSMRRRMWGKYRNVGCVCDSCQQESFQIVSLLSLLWLHFIDPGIKGLTPLSNLFSPLTSLTSATVIWGIWAFRSLCEFTIHGHIFKAQGNVVLIFYEEGYSCTTGIIVCFQNWKSNHKVRVSPESDFDTSDLRKIILFSWLYLLFENLEREKVHNFKRAFLTSPYRFSSPSSYFLLSLALWILLSITSVFSSSFTSLFYIFLIYSTPYSYYHTVLQNVIFMILHKQLSIIN